MRSIVRISQPLERWEWSLEVDGVVVCAGSTTSLSDAVTQCRAWARQNDHPHPMLWVRH